MRFRKRVKSLKQLKILADNRKSVTAGMPFRKPVPAAFLIHLPGALLFNMMEICGIFTYQPKTNKRKK